MSQWINPGERGNFLIPVVVVLILVGVSALGYFAMDTSEPDPEKTVETVGEDVPLETQWTTITEKKENAGLELTDWKGVLSCNSLADRDPFERNVTVQVSEDGVFWERGVAEDFAALAEDTAMVPREFSDTFEWWRGTRSGTQVEVEGWYREGNDKVKPISLSGEAYEGYMFLEGQRGPRDCSYEATRKGADQGSSDDWGS